MKYTFETIAGGLFSFIAFYGFVHVMAYVLVRLYG